MARWYRLVGHEAVPCPDLIEWAQWMEAAAERHVAKDQIGPLYVSTVFLGLDHRHGPGAPLLFETMIFDGGEDSYQVRTETWEQAERAHAEAVRVARAQVESADKALSGS